MIQAKCIQKFRDKQNRIYGYRLQDINGQTQDIQPNNLKQAIFNGQIHVINLTLTKDGRLIDSNEKQIKCRRLGKTLQIEDITAYKNDIEIDAILKEICRGINIPIPDMLYDVRDGDELIDVHYKTNIKYNNKNCSLVITLYNDTNEVWLSLDSSYGEYEDEPDIEFDLSADNNEEAVKKLIKQFVDNVKAQIQGYSYITREIVRQINKSKALTFKSNVTNIETVLRRATLAGNNITKFSEEIILLESSSSMCLISQNQILLDHTQDDIGLFQRTKFTSIDFHNTDTSGVVNMKSMFAECQIDNLDISSFDTSRVEDMSGMFSLSNIKHISSINFNTYYVKDMSYMFAGCKTQYLDLSSFDTSRVIDMSYMFNDCKAKIIDLSSFHIRDSILYRMFDGCNSQIKSTDQRILEAYNNR